MEGTEHESPTRGGVSIETESGGGATNLQRSRSIPEPISDPHVNNSGKLKIGYNQNPG